ncbi:hypothetical protein [Actinoplanes sp. NPDC020271]|uniref:hypothetical protein n=1 Tax=Actinoplanes sp. NPDC020271 TaxID=3363896 RepID=UPI0037A47793
MQPGRLRVDVEALRETGTEVTGPAGIPRDAVKTAGFGFAPATQPGSAAVTAAQAAETVWLADLRVLTDQVAAFGISLNAAVRNYQTNDRASADELRRGVLRTTRRSQCRRATA